MITFDNRLRQPIAACMEGTIGTRDPMPVESLEEMP